MPECAFHPGVETNISCTECERYICPKDMVDTPVGYKCRECGIVGRPKLGGVKPRQLLLGAATGFGAAIVLGILLAFIPFFPLFAAMLYGAAVAEATRRGSGGHRTWEFTAIAAVAALAGAGLGRLVGGGSLLTLLVAPLAAGVYMASARW